MEIEMNVISIETIKPSSPTPKSLQKYELSILDQSMPPIYLPAVYFYPSSNASKPDHLKTSLSEALSRLYPLAGRLVGNHYVDCNDAGVPFVVAEANCRLSKVVVDRDPRNTYRFYPHRMEEAQRFCMAVQATYFSCGGLALALLVSHKLADAVSFIFFAKTWSAISRGGGGGVPLPNLDAASFFPPLTDTSGLDPAASVVAKESIVCRVFSFPAATIARLRESYSGGGERVSRVEALSAFIWAQLGSTLFDPNKIYAMCHTINLRGRADPRLSEYHFGNMVGFSTVVPAAGEGGVDLIRKMRAAVKAVDGGIVASKDFVESLMNGMTVAFSFSSICGFPLHEADFGSGRPIWIPMAHFPLNNTVFFMDAESGGGIDASVHLTKQDMKKFGDSLEMQMLKSNL